jgi:16S rRNA (guanine966-N2)-methyltransferase
VKNELRIIGGQWRSRKLRFPPIPGLRPTPNRVRETLFNWLGQHLEGARCLDLYAGSGALGFEAASRGAARVVQVEFDSLACQALRQHCDLLEARQIIVVQDSVEHFLRGAAEPFDLVFLDPPYAQKLLGPACRLLEQHGWLASFSQVYLESEVGFQPQRQLPPRWHIHRSKQSGEVGYHLCRVSDHPSAE